MQQAMVEGRSRAARGLFMAGASVLVLGLASGQAFAAEAPSAATADAAGAATPTEEKADFGTRVEELVVTGASGAVTNAPVKVSLEATQPQAIIDRQTIDQFIPSTADYTQIVNLSPSVSGTSVNGPGLGESKTTLRGFHDGEYNVTYDGIPWGDANGPTHHSTAFFPSSTIGAVVVDRGPGGASQLGVASFGGSINLFSPEVADVFGGSQSVTAGSWNTLMSVTKINTGEIAALNGARALFNFQELKTDGALTYSGATAYNQMVRAVVPLVDSWKLTLFGTWNYTKVYTNDSSGATLAQVALYGKNFGLSTDPTTPTYYKYNVVNKHTYFNYAKLTGDITPSLKLENTLYSYYYKNDTESALDPTLSVADIAASKGLQITYTPGGKPTVNGHIPGYTKLNVYKIYGDIVHLDQELSFGTIKAGLWWERADTGPRARYDYDATLGRTASGWTVDYRQKVLAGVPQYLEYLQNSGWDQYEPFVDFQWRVTPALTVTPGVKYVSEKLTVDSEVNQKSRLPFHGSKTFTKTLYFLTANYKVRDDLAVYAQYATGFLLPDISATQATNPNLNDLHPQESTNYQAGVVYHGGRFTFDADLYQIDFTNKIQTVTVGSETVNFNLGGARYKGVEGSVTFAATDQVFLFANGSMNSAKAQGANTTIAGVPVVIAGGKQIANAPKSTVALGGLYHNDGWSVSLSDKYTGEQWGAEGEPAAYQIPGYHSADLSVVYRFDRYRIEGAIYNLFDNQPVTAIKPGKTAPYDQYYFQPERNFQVSVKASF
ncbi:MAG: TonB-dependent receptor [Phenylobacterium sp.]|jgi:iron complex outermembrane receptor protein|nr:TonB-dependent receptor [Phenylobacterium sp.]